MNVSLAQFRGGSRHVGVLQFRGGASFASDDSTGTAPPGPVTWAPLPTPGTITPLQTIELPDTVQVGQPVQVIVRTILPDGCWRTDGQDVSQTGNLVQVTPQDANSDAAICTQIFGYGAHTFSVTFATAGTGTIRVIGRRLVQGGQVTNDPVTAERTVVVR